MIVVERIESAHLARNLLGNSSRRDLAVYLPPSYATDRSRRYPVVYLLHGFSSRSTSWGLGPALAFGALIPPIDQLLDEAIASKAAAELIVVMPDGWSAFGCANWLNSPVAGSFESYVAEEVVGYVDAHFRTIPRRESRGITGASSGGMGSWNIGTSNPEVFSAVAPLSAGGHFDVTARSWFRNYFDRQYPRPLAGPVSGEINSWLCYGLASGLSPNVDNPPFFVDLPFEYPSGDVIPAVWDRWLAGDLSLNWRTRQADLRRLRILLDVGSQDELGLQYGHRILSRGLAGAGIAHEAREYEGGHTTYLRERAALACEWFSEVLER
ncbi:MAG: hypothetical protein QOH08_1515 [Chloroflexota bacterium]|jgi:enterochelin esterase-like enzyme|nr:hypothetical protein [Chloroflexota bacterium]